MQQHIYSSSEVIGKIRQINSLTPTSKEKSNISEQEWNNFLNILEETYKFVSRLKHSYPKLTDIDIRICALLKELLEEGKREQAVNALNHCSKVIPVHQLPYHYMNGSLDLAECYYKLKDIEKGDEITLSPIHNSMEYIQWYLSMDNHHWRSTAGSCYEHFYILSQTLKLLEEQSPETSVQYAHAFERLWEAFEAKK